MPTLPSPMMQQLLQIFVYALQPLIYCGSAIVALRMVLKIWRQTRLDAIASNERMEAKRELATSENIRVQMGLKR